MMSQQSRDDQSGAPEKPLADIFRELRTREQRWERNQETLSRALARLALVALGQSSTLDPLLTELRNAVQEGRQRDEVARLAHSVDVTARRLRLPREKPEARSQEENPHPYGVLLDLLNRISFPRPLGPKVRALRAKLRDPDHHTNIDLVVADFASLLHELQEAGGRKGSLRSFFGGDREAARGEEKEPETVSPSVHSLLHGLRPPAPLHQPIDELWERSQGTDAAADLEGIAEELATLLNDYFDRTASLFSEKGSLAPEAIRPLNRLLDLLEEADPDLKEPIWALRKRLYRENQPRDLPGLMGPATDLVARVAEDFLRERGDQEEFLQRMAESLEDLGQHFRNAHSLLQADAQEAEAHEQRVLSDVENLATEVRDSEAPEGLRGTVEARLSSLRQDLEAHRHKATERGRELEQEMEGLTGRIRDIEQESGQIREQIEEKRQEAGTDPLTDLPNRLAFERRARQALTQRPREGGSLSLLLLGVDRLHEVNEAYGQQAGDKALQVIATLVARNLRQGTDLVARYGGEELVCLLPGLTLPEAREMAETLRKAVRRAVFKVQGRPIAEITLSAGLTEIREEDTLEAAFQRVEEAVGAAKHEGADRVRAAEDG